MRLSFKRAEVAKGLAAVCQSSERRGCYIKFDDKCVGDIFNPTCHALHAPDAKDEWRIQLFVVPNNVMLKARFTTLDEAKDFVKKYQAEIPLKFKLRVL